MIRSAIHLAILLGCCAGLAGAQSVATPFDGTFCRVYNPAAAKFNQEPLGSCICGVPPFLHDCYHYTWYVPEVMVSVFYRPSASHYAAWPSAIGNARVAPLISTAAHALVGQLNPETFLETLPPATYTTNEDNGGGEMLLQAQVGPAIFSGDACSEVRGFNLSVGPNNGGKRCILYNTLFDSYMWKTGAFDTFSNPSYLSLLATGAQAGALCALAGVSVNPPNPLPQRATNPGQATLNSYMRNTINKLGDECSPWVNVLPTTVAVATCYGSHFTFPRRGATRGFDVNTNAVVVAIKALSLASTTAGTENFLPGDFICNDTGTACFPYGTLPLVIAASERNNDVIGNRRWAWVVWRLRAACSDDNVATATQPSEVYSWCGSRQPQLMSQALSDQSSLAGAP